jgi:hypothetical protein
MCWSSSSVLNKARSVIYTLNTFVFLGVARGLGSEPRTFWFSFIFSSPFRWAAAALKIRNLCILNFCCDALLHYEVENLFLFCFICTDSLVSRRGDFGYKLHLQPNANLGKFCKAISNGNFIWHTIIFTLLSKVFCSRDRADE